MWWHTRRNQISSFGETDGVHLNRRGRQFSRLLAAEVCASAVVMLDTPCSEVVWRLQATHSIRQFPLHFPSRASPCAITFQLESTTLHPKEKRKWTYHDRIRFPSVKLPRQAASCNMLSLWVRKWLVYDSYAISQRSLWSSQEISMLRSALQRRTLPITSIKLSLWEVRKFVAWIFCVVYI